MNQPIFFDEIAQIFLADGNFHIVLGLTTGEVATNGKDIKSTVAKLIIPQNKLITLMPELSSAISQLTQNLEIQEEFEAAEKPPSKSYEGQPLIYKI